MSGGPEEIPEDKKEAHQCPACSEGTVTENARKYWECDKCPWDSSQLQDAE